VLELSQLRPYLVQKLCVHALNRMLEQGRSSVRLEDVDAAAEAALTVEDTQLESEPSALERPAMAD